MWYLALFKFRYNDHKVKSIIRYVSKFEIFFVISLDPIRFISYKKCIQQYKIRILNITC